MLRARLFLSLLPFAMMILAMGAYVIALFSQLAQSVDRDVAGHYESIFAAQGNEPCPGGHGTGAAIRRCHA